jgi:kynurenine formamidase
LAGGQRFADLKKMKIVDLSHSIHSGMPVYPGAEPPEFLEASSIAKNGFLEKKISLYSHTGTHLDAPAHIIRGAKTLDQLPVEHFSGKACLIDLTPVPTKEISLGGLFDYREPIRDSEFLIIKTGWSRYWGSSAYFRDYPTLSLEAAEWLAEFHLKGVGLDTISADKSESSTLPIHKKLLQQGTLLIENLTNLDGCSCHSFIFCCFPLKFVAAEGAPVRAVGIMP